MAQYGPWNLSSHVYPICRMWSDDNVYAKQNGGKYNFIVEPTSDPTVAAALDTASTLDLSGPELRRAMEAEYGASAVPGKSGLAIPTDQSLWDDLMSNKVMYKCMVFVHIVLSSMQLSSLYKPCCRVTHTRHLPQTTRGIPLTVYEQDWM